jgi:membrane protein YdbS with pleckstrin-like domain
VNLNLSKALIVVAFVLAIFAVITATGTVFVTTWPVWVSSALAAYFLALIVA